MGATSIHIINNSRTSVQVFIPTTVSNRGCVGEGGYRALYTFSNSIIVGILHYCTHCTLVSIIKWFSLRKKVKSAHIYESIINSIEELYD